MVLSLNLLSIDRKSTHLLKCLDQLLSSGHFSRNGVDVSETLSHCISISINPIHPVCLLVINLN